MGLNEFRVAIEDEVATLLANDFVIFASSALISSSSRPSR
jgi:hypothetical protein